MKALEASYLNPYIIAEIGVNHEGSMDLARHLIDEAKEGGAHAVKFQTYKAETIAMRNSPAYWDQTKEPTASQFELFKKYDTFQLDDYAKLAEHCVTVGIDFLSTPFDLASVGYLDPLVDIHKIASADITNVPLLRAVASKEKPVILSTGAASLPEIAHSIDVLTAAGATDLILLHCVLNYPTPPDHAQLGLIGRLKQAFPLYPVGYSDHTIPGKDMAAMQVAVLLGAVVLEKHFTHDKSLPGNDHYHAMTKDDLAAFVARLTEIKVLVGSGPRKLCWEEPARANARRSLVAARALRAGETIREDCLVAKRPASGLSPIYWDDAVGSRAFRDINEDEPLSWADILR
jgi:N-acetylneuraminate synthase